MNDTADLDVLQGVGQDPEALTPEEQKKQEESKEVEIQRILRELVKIAEKEDEDIRIPMLLRAKRNNSYFNNIQTIFYNEEARDYRDINAILNLLTDINGNVDIKTANVYRAFAESLIAALSVSAPPVEFTPDDADNPDDVETARTYTSIHELISRHTHAGLMLIKALTILFNQGVVCAYNYYKTDPSYGVIQTPKDIAKRPVRTFDLRCSNCSEMLDSGIPENQSVQAASIPYTCHSCGFEGPPKIFPKIDYVDEVTSYEETPKGRVGFDLFGCTHVKIPLYARNAEGIGYCSLRLDDHIAKFQTLFDPDGELNIQPGGGDTYLYDRWARIPAEYYQAIPKDITTCRYTWFRPWYYRALKVDDAKVLQKEFPTGVMVAVIGDIVVDYEHEKLDNRWTFSFDPRSDFIHAEPAGNALVPMQDATNDIFNLGLQSIEYGIPETFVHPKTVNLQAYKKTPASPGMMAPAFPPPGNSNSKLADGFHTVQTATLSSEYTAFAASLKSLTEFVTGALPTIFGGSLPNSENTATEYTESRARALQRLQLVWQMIGVFWCQLMYKCVVDYATNLREDEKFSSRKNGTYINTWIKKSSLQGKAGHVEPETAGQLPQSWQAKRDLLVQLIGFQNPEIGAILLHPNNSENVKQAIGMQEFYIPGENDRNKQWSEFYDICNGEPNGPVTIDLIADKHEIHMEVLQDILVSPRGMQLYRENPALYNKQIQHYMQHEQAVQQKMMQQQNMVGNIQGDENGNV